MPPTQSMKPHQDSPKVTCGRLKSALLGVIVKRVFQYSSVFILIIAKVFIPSTFIILHHSMN